MDRSIKRLMLDFDLTDEPPGPRIRGPGGWQGLGGSGAAWAAPDKMLRHRERERERERQTGGDIYIYVYIYVYIPRYRHRYRLDVDMDTDTDIDIYVHMYVVKDIDVAIALEGCELGVEGLCCWGCRRPQRSSERRGRLHGHNLIPLKGLQDWTPKSYSNWSSPK